MDSQQTAYVISDLVTMLHDAPTHERTHENSRVLELYFNDLYKLFLMKLGRFEAATDPEEVDILRLRSMLDELISVKHLLLN